MTNIQHENSADISTFNETGTAQQITQTDCNFRDQYLKQAPKLATTFNKEPVASQCTRDRHFSSSSAFLLRPKFLREFFRDKISQLEARLIKKMALTPELVST